LANQKAVIVGASSGVGRALAGELARHKYDLVVAARSRRDLEAVAADLSLRHRVEVYPEPLDLGQDTLHARKFVKRCYENLGEVSSLFFPVGAVDARDCGPADPEIISRALRVNYAGVVLIAAEFAKRFEKANEGCLVLFSSIAAAAPRGRNTTYSSAKAGIEVYGKGLRHYFARSRVTVQIYALGYVATSMTFGLDLRLPVTSPERVAAYIVKNLPRDRGLVYFPRFWGLIVRLLRHLPWSVYRRLSF
jgi:decaprenylphospho-beta-D-erythro-pentofuranosid-2-ulose 2-reductase